MELGRDAAVRAWARLVGLPSLERLRVFVDDEAPLGPRGWIAILAVGGTVMARVPRPELEDVVRDALAGVDADHAVDPQVMRGRLPPTRSVLGPAFLFYAPDGFVIGRSDDADTATTAEFEALVADASPADLDESGLDHIESPPFVSRTASGAVAACCGYRAWPNGVAHIAVFTRDADRGQGHGRRAASAAVQHAVDNDLLPQWRARPIASQRLAESIGFVRMGAQLSFEPA